MWLCFGPASATCCNAFRRLSCINRKRLALSSTCFQCTNLNLREKPASASSCQLNYISSANSPEPYLNHTKASLKPFYLSSCQGITAHMDVHHTTLVTFPSHFPAVLTL